MFQIPEKQNKKSYLPRIRTGYYRVKGGLTGNKWQHIHLDLLMPIYKDGKLLGPKFENGVQVFDYDNKGKGPLEYMSFRGELDDEFSLLISIFLRLREYGKYFYTKPGAMRSEIQKRLDGVYESRFDDRIKLFGTKHKDGTWEYRVGSQNEEPI